MIAIYGTAAGLALIVGFMLSKIIVAPTEGYKGGCWL